MKDRPPTHRIAPVATQRARSLRNNPSVPERVLWSMLRRKQIKGLRFRRQVPIGPYVVDFCCPAAKLVVELDGVSHDDQQAQDARRTEFIEQQGYRVIRVTNHELATNREGVWQFIFSNTVVSPTPDPPPSPLPKREGEPIPRATQSAASTQHQEHH